MSYMTLEEIRQYRNTVKSFSNYLGMECTELGEGYAKTILKASDNLLNPQGAAHGGLLYTLADVAGNSACSSHGEFVATLDSDFHFLRAGLNLETLTAVAREIKHGKRLSVCYVEVSDQTGKILATGTFTYSTLGKKYEK